MTSLPPSPFRRSRVLRALSLSALLAACASLAFAQNDPNAPGANGGRQRRNQQNADAAGAGNNNNNNNANGGGRQGRGNFDPAQMQEQMMSRLREQFGVNDDAEWKVISDRITAVNEARRTNAGGGAFGLRGGPGGGGGGGGGQNGGGGGQGRGFGRGGSPESDALRQAVTDNLPEAEIKSRLERLRDARKANDEKLTKAQDDLRAVLTVRQEAICVMFGLLP